MTLLTVPLNRVCNSSLETWFLFSLSREIRWVSTGIVHCSKSYVNKTYHRMNKTRFIILIESCLFRVYRSCLLFVCSCVFVCFLPVFSLSVIKLNLSIYFFSEINFVWGFSDCNLSLTSSNWKSLYLVTCQLLLPLFNSVLLFMY